MADIQYKCIMTSKEGRKELTKELSVGKVEYRGANAPKKSLFRIIFLVNKNNILPAAVQRGVVHVVPALQHRRGQEGRGKKNVANPRPPPCMYRVTS